MKREKIMAPKRMAIGRLEDEVAKTKDIARELGRMLSDLASRLWRGVETKDPLTSEEVLALLHRIQLQADKL